MSAQEIRLATRPNGWPTQENFELARVDVPTPAEGQATVRNLLMSVDPYMLGQMSDAKSYVPPFQVGKALDGAAIGEVVDSRTDEFRPGDIVLHNLGWRDHALVEGRGTAKIDTSLAPMGAYLGVLGGPGLTAYIGLFDIARFKPGDAIFVSAAAGAVGSSAGQLAKVKGASRVIGSAGSAEKVRHLVDELGVDAAINYREAPIAEQLRAAAPDGIDVYFDNVGGDHLEAALGTLNNFGRVVACGAISTYNATEPPPGPRNMMNIVQKRLQIRGFIVTDHFDRRADFLAEVGPLVRDGKIRHQETVVDGLENAPQAFLDMLGGANTGKMLVKIAD